MTHTAPHTHRPIPVRALAVAWLLVLLATPLAAAEVPYFTEATDLGIDFVHWNAMAGELHFVEMMGPGGALFDADGDGDLDLYIVQGAPLGEAKPLKPYPGSGTPRDRFFRNDTEPSAKGSPQLRFTDITDASGLNGVGYGQGVAIGDVDNDGRPDLYIANFGRNQLWRNSGVKDGVPTFEDWTDAAGVGDERWSIGASFIDIDGDGWLDLYVVDYVEYSLDNNITCYAPSSRRDYCGPSAFPPVPDRLYRNRGPGADGRVTFEDISIRAGLNQAPGPGLGVLTADFDLDGKLDLFVANDGKPNQLWVVRGKGKDLRLVDDALLAGVAVNRLGQPEASMGVAAADYDSDGDDDLFMTHLTNESNTLYINGGGLFDDRSREAGLASASLPFTAFGTGFLDLENDGWLDLLVVNGAVRVLEEQIEKGDALPLAQSNQVFRNVPGAPPVVRRFEDVTARSGAVADAPAVSRGAAFGDLDNDGDTDAIVLDNNSRARFLLNRHGQDQPWLGLRLVGGDPALDRPGARAELVRRGAPTLWRRSASDGSFGSASDPRVLFGLGGGTDIETLRVHWPDGQVERFATPPLGRYTTLRQGKGLPKADTSDTTHTSDTNQTSDKE